MDFFMGLNGTLLQIKVTPSCRSLIESSLGGDAIFKNISKE
ncbi:hypothetical protein AM1_0915 [Acaryochloris marina MBIC11017]|uniref:Uncharacterized protein n=1 Tax=Acaryochloris marina (strain MBIC 11017) TaxID=329726 RepID=B0BZN1_ACAM1|nr:hypothetical protein AM1_0915 [Acaryochloris marina MBIC11017]